MPNSITAADATMPSSSTTATNEAAAPPSSPPVLLFSPPPPPPPPPPMPIRPSTAPLLSASRPTGLAVPPSVPRPRTTTKRLQWTKIPASQVAAAGPGNIWAVVSRLADSETSMPDFGCLEELFAAGSAAGGGGSSSSSLAALAGPSMSGSCEGLTTLERRKKIDEINVLDSKRSMNVNIYLRQFGAVSQSSVGHSDVVRWLREGSSELMGAERLRGLLKILPDEDDIERLTPYLDLTDRTRLGAAERFYIELLSLPNYKLIVEALLMKEEFQTTVDSIKPAIDAIILSARDIRESKALQEIICTVLMAGNFLNTGGYAGEAAGFRLSSLLKLTEIRANKPRMNLMHFVAMESEKSNSQLAEQLRQLKYLAEASQYSVDSLLSDIKSLQERVWSISERMFMVDEQFRNRMKPFVEAAQSEMKLLELDQREIEELRVELATYFCEDVKTFCLDDCISTFNAFCQRFLKAIEENHERHLLNEQAEQRRRQREKQLAVKKNKYGQEGGATSSGSGDESTTSPTESAASFVSRRQSAPDHRPTDCTDGGGGGTAVQLNRLQSGTEAMTNSLRRRSADNAAARQTSTAAADLVEFLLASGGADSDSGSGAVSGVGVGGTGRPRRHRRRSSTVGLTTDVLNVERERTPSPRHQLEQQSTDGQSQDADGGDGRLPARSRDFRCGSGGRLRSAASVGQLQALLARDENELGRSATSTTTTTTSAADSRFASTAPNEMRRSESIADIRSASMATPTKLEHENRRLERRRRRESSCVVTAWTNDDSTDEDRRGGIQLPVPIGGYQSGNEGDEPGPMRSLFDGGLFDAAKKPTQSVETRVVDDRLDRPSAAQLAAPSFPAKSDTQLETSDEDVDRRIADLLDDLSTAAPSTSGRRMSTMKEHFKRLSKFYSVGDDPDVRATMSFANQLPAVQLPVGDEPSTDVAKPGSGSSKPTPRSGSTEAVKSTGASKTSGYLPRFGTSRQAAGASRAGADAHKTQAATSKTTGRKLPSSTTATNPTQTRKLAATRSTPAATTTKPASAEASAKRRTAQKPETTTTSSRTSSLPSGRSNVSTLLRSVASAVVAATRRPQTSTTTTTRRTAATTSSKASTSSSSVPRPSRSGPAIGSSRTATKTSVRGNSSDVLHRPSTEPEEPASRIASPQRRGNAVAAAPAASGTAGRVRRPTVSRTNCVDEDFDDRAATAAGRLGQPRRASVAAATGDGGAACGGRSRLSGFGTFGR